MAENQIQDRVKKVKRGLLHLGDQPQEKQDLKIKAAEYMTRFILAFLLSGARIFGEAAPFAAGFCAASGSGGAGISALTGAALGYLVFGGVYWSMKYVAMCILIFASAVVFRKTEFPERPWFLPLLASFMAACTGFVYAADSGWQFSVLSVFVAESVLVGASAYFYKIAFSPWSGRLDFEQSSETRHTVSIIILLSTLLISLSSLSIFEFISVGRILAVLLVMLVSFKGGAGLGCATGLCVGVAMDSALNMPPFFSMIYGVSGLLSGIFSRHGRFLFVLSFIAANAVCVIAAWRSAEGLACLYEVFAASVVCMILPHSLLSRIGAVLPGSPGGYGVLKAREYARNHVEQISLAFHDLFDTVKTAAGADRNDNEIATLFDRASDATCRACLRRNRCWLKNYEDTFNTLNDLVPIMMERGKLLESDYPAHFSDSCLNLQGFTDAVNLELRALFARRQYLSRLKENRSAAFNQYADIAAVLKDLASQLGSEVEVESLLEKKLHRYLRSLSIEAGTAVFRDRGGRLHAEISTNSLGVLKKEDRYLDKLSAVLNTRMCALEDSAPDRLTLFEAEPLAAAVGIASLKKVAWQSNGDSGSYFKTDEGLLYVILSDGMGTGDEAAKLSGDTVRILERFLRAGVPVEVALRLLNDLMLLKNDNDTGCATVDLLSISLFSGDTHMFKYGAAPSFLRQGGRVSRLNGRSLAAGLGIPPLDEPDIIHMKLCAGNYAVVVSDGVLGGEDDKWLQDMLLGYEGPGPKELAQAILDRARNTFVKEDDMTVLAVQVTDRA